MLHATDAAVDAGRTRTGEARSAAVTTARVRALGRAAVWAAAISLMLLLPHAGSMRPALGSTAPMAVALQDEAPPSEELPAAARPAGTDAAERFAAPAGPAESEPPPHRFSGAMVAVLLAALLCVMIVLGVAAAAGYFRPWARRQGPPPGSPPVGM